MKVDLNQFTGHCGCGHTHHISVKGIVIEPKACRYLANILHAYRFPVFICDTLTGKAAKEALSEYFQKYTVIELPVGNLHADDRNVETLSRQLHGQADVLIAVGSGTIHDLTRYTSFHRDIPFISVPTAASVDGFVSTVAAMTWHGIKKTFPAAAPIYVLADTDIFSRAPYRLTASGISDLMGKYTALADWKIAHMVTGEYFCPRICELEMEAVTNVESILNEIPSGDGIYMEKLMYALLLSGLAMQMIGNSRPASGAEHHISHLWEMNVINDPIDALHGEKVSVGLLLTLKKYEEISHAIRAGKCHVVDSRKYETALLKDTFGTKGLYEGIMEENGENILNSIDLDRLTGQLQAIASELEKLPKHEAMEQELKKAGCRTSMADLKLPNIEKLTLALSPYVRRRLTFMRLSKLLQLTD